MSLTTQIAELLRPYHRRIMLMIGRGTLTLTNDGAGQQRAQVSLLDGETRDNVDRIQQYGLSSVPPPGATAVVVCVGGSRDHPMIIAVDEPRSRPSGGQPGEVVVYSAFGQVIRLREDGGLEMTTEAGDKIEMTPDREVRIETLKLRIEAPVVEMTGALTAASVTEGAV